MRRLRAVNYPDTYVNEVPRGVIHDKHDAILA